MDAVEVSTAYRVLHIPFSFAAGAPELDQDKLTAVEYSGPAPDDVHFRDFINGRWAELGGEGYMLVCRRTTPIVYPDSTTASPQLTEAEKTSIAAGVPTKIKSGLDTMSSVSAALHQIEKRRAARQAEWVKVLACINDTWSHWFIDYQNQVEGKPAAVITALRDEVPPWVAPNCADGGVPTDAETAPEDSQTARSAA